MTDDFPAALFSEDAMSHEKTREYASYLETFDLTEEEKIEFLRALHSLLEQLVEQALSE